tara:strand:+ start:61 stop:1131 length:1071 start_codon:yes stop_codon:yes gene_type:complete
MNDLYFNSVELIEKVNIPHDSIDNINEKIYIALTTNTNKFKELGYIKEKSIKILSRSFGYLNNLVNVNTITYNVKYDCLLFNPQKNDIYLGLIKNKNEVGVQVEIYYYNNVNKIILFYVYIPYELFENKLYSHLDIDTKVYIELIGIKYQYDSSTIKGIGKILSDDEIIKLQNLKEIIINLLNIDIPEQLYNNIKITNNNLKLIFNPEEYNNFSYLELQRLFYIYSYISKHEINDFQEYIYDELNKLNDTKILQTTLNMKIINNECIHTEDELKTDGDLETNIDDTYENDKNDLESINDETSLLDEDEDEDINENLEDDIEDLDDDDDEDDEELEDDDDDDELDDINSILDSKLTE